MNTYFFMQENAVKKMTNKAPSYLRAQCASMELMLSKHDKNRAPAADSLKIESQTPISVIFHEHFDLKHLFLFISSCCERH